MNRIQKETMFKEIKNFKQISREYKYRNIGELVGHYIEEDVINSKEELIKTISLIKNKLGVSIDIRNFKDCRSN
jgi:hypothetical protein